MADKRKGGVVSGGKTTGGKKPAKPKYEKDEFTVKKAGAGTLKATNTYEKTKGGREYKGTTYVGGTDLPRGKGGRLGSLKDTMLYKALVKQGFSEKEALDTVKSQRKNQSKGFTVLPRRDRKKTNT